MKMKKNQTNPTLNEHTVTWIDFDNWVLCLLMCTAMCDIVQLCRIETPVFHVRVDDCRLGEGVETQLASLHGSCCRGVALTPTVYDHISRLVYTYSGKERRKEGNEFIYRASLIPDSYIHVPTVWDWLSAILKHMGVGLVKCVHTGVWPWGGIGMPLPYTKHSSPD